jgi:BirA family biotin operon repressor/biotin-[acetyl-CoA-carboxylase] ligase
MKPTKCQALPKCLALGGRFSGQQPLTNDLSALTIGAALTTRRLGRPALFFPTVASTNDVIHQHAAAGAGEGLLVVADEQTAGRGRLDRRWWAPPGTSLLISLLLRPPIPAGRAGQMTMCLGLAAAEGIEQTTGLRPALKWPNDLLLDGRKLGGILTELRTTADRLEYAALGLGVNVNVEFDERRMTGDDREWAAIVRRRSLAETAASLSSALGRPVERLALLVAILARCEAWYDRLLAGESLHRAWAARLDTLGRSVTATLPGGALQGVATGVTAEGALLVRDEEGRVHMVWAGDIAPSGR